MKLNQEIVRELFDYDANVGKLSWKKLTPLREKKGGVVGYKHCMGYQAVSILGEEYLVHRIIWLWNYGYMPEHVIDHIDKDKQNNKLNNLREAAKIANTAAGIVVGRVGTSVVKVEEIIEFYEELDESSIMEA